jgi:hypothetical protein
MMVAITSQTCRSEHEEYIHIQSFIVKSYSVHRINKPPVIKHIQWDGITHIYNFKIVSKTSNIMNYYPLCKNVSPFLFIKLNVAINLPNILYIFLFTGQWPKLAVTFCNE